jgi:NAD+ synthase (glutamine-hydrolysing)
MKGLRIAIAQIETIVGDIQGNADKIISWVHRAREADADLVCFPELAVTGYPPEDLLLMPHFIQKNLEALERISRSCQGICALVGFVDREDDIFNAAALLCDGQQVATYRKQFLPTYGVFDEDRYFQPGGEALVANIRGVRVGVSICEDLWYPVGPARTEALHGSAEVLVNISSSPFHVGKLAFRERMLGTRASDNGVFLAYANAVGAQDELVFDGQSLILSPQGEVMARGKAFEEELIIGELQVTSLLRSRLADPRRRKEKIFEVGHALPLRTVALEQGADRARRPRGSATLADPLSLEEEILRALRLGTRCYVRNNGFREVVVGLSGGIDSALTAAIAAQALGPEAVVGVAMPSAFTSRRSMEDARSVARSLGIRVLEIPIQNVQNAYLAILAEAFCDRAPDVAEENLQARIRGNVLMALSNKFGWLVLTTGNKSETSTGYCTLYGDMAGGFGVIKDVPKTWVYRLARHINREAGRDVIPASVIERPPTAELREGQLDTDSLPPYEVLDPILQAYVEDEMGPDEIARMGSDRRTVVDVIRMVDRSEYKRRQSPPGIKITTRAFGKDRRLPITNKYRVE